jgi:hypothetical protein
VRFEGMPYFSLRQGGRNLTRLTLFAAIIGSILFLQAMALFPAALIYVGYSLVQHMRREPEILEDEDDAEEWTDHTRF